MSYFDKITQQVQGRIAPALKYVSDTLSLNILPYVIDHICWRCETEIEYHEVLAELLTHGELEGGKAVLVSNRPISTIRLNAPIKTAFGDVCFIELPSPKPGSPYDSGIEHIEVTINESFESFMQKYAHLPWLTSGLKKSHHPHVELDLKKQFSVMVKFNRETLESKIKDGR